MRTISILPEAENSYRALAGDKESTGRTAGEALDALSAQLAGEEGTNLVIVQNYEPDEFFTAAQQERLTELMRRHKAGGLSAEEERELDGLVEAELDGARLRAESILAAHAHAEEPAPVAVERGERVREVSAFLERLVRYEQHMLLLHLEGHTPQEIAAALNTDERVVRHDLNKLRSKLRARLKLREYSSTASAPEKSENMLGELDDLTA